MEGISYSTKGITLAELNQLLDQMWDDLQHDSDVRRRAEHAGVDLGQLAHLDRNSAICVTREATQGFDPATTAVIIAFAPVAAKMTRDLWDKVLLPRILHQKGETALQPVRHD